MMDKEYKVDLCVEEIVHIIEFNNALVAGN